MKERAMGLLGKKLGMTQIFTEEGMQIPVTVVQVGPCTVLAKRTTTSQENGKSDSYTALQLGFDDKPEKKISKPQAGHFKKSGGKGKRYIKEFRVLAKDLDTYEVGQELTVELLEGLDHVDVIGNVKGRGYTGVMKRHNFAGFPETHGTHEYKRHGGSIGSVTATRVNKGQKMPGHYGTNQVTIQNLKVVEIDKENNLMLIKGAIPGHKNSYITVMPAIKKTNKAAK